MRKDIEKRDKQNYSSHHKQNFLIEISNNKGAVKRALVNAIDSTQAIRILFNRLKKGFNINITRARVIAVYKNTSKQIKIKKDCL